jgi:hypothetical protein
MNDVQRHSNDVVAMKEKLYGLYPNDHQIVTVDASPHKGTLVHVYDRFGRRVDARWVKINDGS